MDVSRREALAIGAGVGSGLLAGGLVGAGLHRTVSEDEPIRRIVGTRDDETVEAACDAVADEEAVVDLGDRRTLVVGPLDDEALEGLRATHQVDYVEPDHPVEAVGAVGATRATTQTADSWGVRRVNAPAAHAAGYRGDGARVAVVDSGVSPHPDVAPNVAEGAAFVDCEDGCADGRTDETGHGTACAGVLAATGSGGAITGVAPGATVLPVKVLDAGNVGRVSLVVEGLRWATDRCDVANLSLTGAASRAFDDAVQYAVARDTVIVAAAGNVGPCENCVSPLAAHPETVAVTATNRQDGLAAFSASGPEAELAAPGVGVRTTGTEGYVSVSGTSFAAPHVAGAAALCRAAGRTASATRLLLTGTASDLDLSVAAQGHGLVDAEAAVVPAVRTHPPEVDGRQVTFRGSVPRVEERAEVWFDFRWRPRRRWRETPLQTVEEAGSFARTVRLRRGLTYLVRARARFPDGTTVVGERHRFRVPIGG